LQPAGDFAFAGARPVELPDLISMEGRRYWSAQALAILTGMRQAGTYPFPQSLPFELGPIQVSSPQVNPIYRSS
jgi:hypothetical protein